MGRVISAANTAAAPRTKGKRGNMKRRPSTQLTKIILLVSFLILFGRLLYAAIASVSHHQERREAQRVEQSIEGESPGPHETDLTP
ncbi:Protein of uncharacterised function (DUF2633) [Yersinia enterocolitica]|nr:Protein of uncharacterised function (DUF2633) [Yersinia enterocolitica]